MQNVPVVDQPRWPALESIATPASMIFKMVWKTTGEPVKYDDPSRHFRFTGTRATCQLEAQIEVPSIGFSWKSDPLSTSKADFAIMGEEVNGRHYAPSSGGRCTRRIPGRRGRTRSIAGSSWRHSPG